MKRILLFMGLAASAYGFCGCDQESTGGTGKPEVGEAQGAMSFEVTAGYDDVAGFSFEVYDTDSQLVDSRYVELEEEFFPSHLRPDLGDKHRFADAFFTLLAGKYVVWAKPMKSFNEPSVDCEPVQQETEVFESETTEIVLVSKWDMPDQGGLDVIATTNHDPVITSLAFAPSKFVTTCEELTLTVDATDPDGDDMTYEWTISGPQGAEFEFSFDADVAHFVALTPGDYTGAVTVCDTVIEQLCASLSFPIHVTGEQRGYCCEQQEAQEELWTNASDFEEGTGEDVFYDNDRIEIPAASEIKIKDMWVPSSNDNKVVLFDLETLQPKQTLNTCANPSRLGRDPQDNVYVTCRNQGVVEKFSTEGVLLWSKNVEDKGCNALRGAAYLPALDPADATVYIGCSNVGKVLALNAETGTVVAEISTKKVYGLATDGERLYLNTSWLENCKVIQGIDLTAKRVIWTTPMTYPYGIVARNGKVWIASYTANPADVVCRLNGQTGVLEGCTSGGTWGYGRGIGVAPDGTVWAADSQHHGVIKVDPNTFELLGQFPSSGNGTLGVDFDNDGYVYAINYVSSNITKMDMNGNIVATFGQGALNNPYAYSSDLTGVNVKQLQREGQWVSNAIDLGADPADVQLISWSFSNPANTSVLVEYSLNGGDWLAATNGEGLGLTTGSLQLRVTMISNNTQESPWVDDLLVRFQPVCPCEFQVDCPDNSSCTGGWCIPE